MSQSVFLDSGIFVAFLNRRDQWHEEAVSLFGGPPPSWRTSLLVVSEAYSWFLHRLGEEAARRFLSLVKRLVGLKVFEVARMHHLEVLRMLDRFRGAKLTYVDASSLCFIEREGIRCIWSTDHHLSLTGATVLPRT